MKKLVLALAILSLAAHLAYLPPTLEDLDSVNFALGVRDFDVAHHQPHPPGYPAFIALGKIGTSVLAMAGVPAPEVRGLAVWSAVAAGALPLVLFAFVRAITGDEIRAAAAAGVTACCPLVWFTGVRPLSDMSGFAVAFASIASAQPFVSISGAPCAVPPVLHCPDADCSSDRVINQGPIVEMKTRRTYFLDYPCDLKADEKVTFVLSLHGAGSYGNWQRHYFPIVDYKDKYRLVIATPNSDACVVGVRRQYRRTS